MAGIDGEPSSGLLEYATYSTPATATSTIPSASSTPRNGDAPVWQPHSGDNYSTVLSSSATKVVLCTTTIGGTVILALLIYAMWRKHRGASYSDIVRFRPQSDQDMAGPGWSKGSLTALPIYRQKRFSAGSPRHSMLPPTKKVSNGSTLAKECRPQTPEPLVPSRPKTSKSGKTLRQKDSGTFLNATPPRPRTSAPEKSHSGIHRPSADLPVTGHFIHSKTTYHNMKQMNRPSTAPNQAPFAPKPRRDPHLEALDAPDRWSWTNSQAPPTPRIIPPGRLSFSARSIRSMSSWATTGSKKKDNEPKMPSPLRPKPQRQRSRQELLKNQAVQPVLAPPPARSRASKWHGHGRVGSLSSIFKPNPHSLIPAPLSPRAVELSAGTPGSIEMAQKT